MAGPRCRDAVLDALYGVSHCQPSPSPGAAAERGSAASSNGPRPAAGAGAGIRKGGDASRLRLALPAKSVRRPTPRICAPGARCPEAFLFLLPAAGAASPRALARHTAGCKVGRRNFAHECAPLVLSLGGPSPSVPASRVIRTGPGTSGSVGGPSPLRPDRAGRGCTCRAAQVAPRDMPASSSVRSAPASLA